MSKNDINENILTDEFCQCISILKRTDIDKRNTEEIKVIREYLNTLTYFLEIQQYEPKNCDNIITTIANKIKYKFCDKNKYIFKYGKKGTDLYFILKGKISIIVIEQKNIVLSYDEYIFNLLKLWKYEEHELLKLTISLNNNIFPINDPFNVYIKNLYNNQIKLHELKAKIEKKTEENFNKGNALKNSHIESAFLGKEFLYSEQLIKYIENVFPELKRKETIDKEKYKNEDGKQNKNEYIIEKFDDTEITPDKLMMWVNFDGFNIGNNIMKKTFTIPIYAENNTFATGKYFGNEALENENNKRMSTIISLEDCHLGTIDKDVYLDLLCDINKKMKKSFYDTLCKIIIFKGIPKGIFEHHYYNLFEYHIYSINTFLYECKKKTNVYYILKKGKFSIRLIGNIIDINNVLIKLKEEKKNTEIRIAASGGNFSIINSIKRKYLNSEEKELNENEELYENKKFETKEFNKVMLEKNEFKLGTFECNDLIGLSDLINNISNISYFDVRTDIKDCEVYSINKQSLNIIFKDYPESKKIFEMYSNKKLESMIQRLEIYKKNYKYIYNKKQKCVLSKLRKDLISNSTKVNDFQNFNTTMSPKTNKIFNDVYQKTYQKEDIVNYNDSNNINVSNTCYNQKKSNFLGKMTRAEQIKFKETMLEDLSETCKINMNRLNIKYAKPIEIKNYSHISNNDKKNNDKNTLKSIDTINNKTEISKILKNSNVSNFNESIKLKNTYLSNILPYYTNYSFINSIPEEPPLTNRKSIQYKNSRCLTQQNDLYSNNLNKLKNMENNSKSYYNKTKRRLEYLNFNSNEKYMTKLNDKLRQCLSKFNSKKLNQNLLCGDLNYLVSSLTNTNFSKYGTDYQKFYNRLDEIEKWQDYKTLKNRVVYKVKKGLNQFENDLCNSIKYMNDVNNVFRFQRSSTETINFLKSSKKIPNKYIKKLSSKFLTSSP